MKGGHHSLIINILNDSFLEDLNSTNGTYVNGKLIKKHAMQHGDVITVGHHQLRFVDSQDGDVEQDEFEKTMVITPSSQGEDRIRKHHRGGGPGCWKAVASKRPTVPDNATALPKAKLQVLSGAFAGRELELTKALTTLGRPGGLVPPRSRGVLKGISSFMSTAAKRTIIRRSTARADRTAGAAPQRQRCCAGWLE